MKKGIILLTAASCLTVVGTLATVAAVKSNETKLNVVHAEPSLRTLTINEAPVVEDGKFSVRTEAGAVLNFTCENFTPGGTFGSINGEGNFELKYDDAASDIIFANLYSITLNHDGFGVYFDFRYIDPSSRLSVSTGNTGVVSSGTEILASEHLVDVDDGGGASHNEVPNKFQIYTVNGEHTITSVVIKYTC